MAAGVRRSATPFWSKDWKKIWTFRNQQCKLRVLTVVNWKITVKYIIINGWFAMMATPIVVLNKVFSLSALNYKNFLDSTIRQKRSELIMLIRRIKKVNEWSAEPVLLIILWLISCIKTIRPKSCQDFCSNSRNGKCLFFVCNAKNHDIWFVFTNLFKQAKL